MIYMNKLNLFTKLFKHTKHRSSATVQDKNLFFIKNPCDRGTFKRVEKEARFFQQRMSGYPTVNTPYPGKSGHEGKSLQELLARFAPQNPPHTKQNIQLMNRFQQSNMEL